MIRRIVGVQWLSASPDVKQLVRMVFGGVPEFFYNVFLSENFTEFLTACDNAVADVVEALGEIDDYASQSQIYSSWNSSLVQLWLEDFYMQNRGNLVACFASDLERFDSLDLDTDGCYDHLVIAIFKPGIAYAKTPSVPRAFLRY